MRARCVKGLSVVITGAPNLSNEAGVRGEVRSVSEGRERRVGNEDGGVLGDLREDKVSELRGENGRQGCVLALERGHRYAQVQMQINTTDTNT